MATRRSVWSDAGVQELLRSFVPAADEVSALQRADGREGELFREVAEQGHYAGRTQPTNTRQGIYATAPSGKLLASINTRSAEQMRAMLERALAAWAALQDEERWLPAEEVTSDPGFRWRSLYPTDGIALRVYSRDLPRGEECAPEPADWRGEASNRDVAWFRRDELASFLPETLAVGSERAVDAAIVRRLARLNLVDDVRGQVSAFEEGDVDVAELASKVVAVDGERVELALSGRTRAVARGRWAVDGYEDMHAPAEQERGVETELAGHAVWDRATGRFADFQLVALGTRWGGTQYNGRGDDLAPAGIGFAFVTAAEGDRVPPAMIWAYGWPRGR